MSHLKWHYLRLPFCWITTGNGNNFIRLERSVQLRTIINTLGILAYLVVILPSAAWAGPPFFTDDRNRLNIVGYPLIEMRG
jgi:hypothetical protein